LEQVTKQVGSAVSIKKFRVKFKARFQQVTNKSVTSLWQIICSRKSRGPGRRPGLRQHRSNGIWGFWALCANLGSPLPSFTIQLVQNCAAISATAELLLYTAVRYFYTHVHSYGSSCPDIW